MPVILPPPRPTSCDLRAVAGPQRAIQRTEVARSRGVAGGWGARSRGWSAVGVSWAASVVGPALPARPRRCPRPEHPKLADRALTDVLGQAGQQARGEQPQLGGPRRGVGPHREHTVLEDHRGTVQRDLRPDDLRPPPDDRPHAHRWHLARWPRQATSGRAAPHRPQRRDGRDARPGRRAPRVLRAVPAHRSRRPLGMAEDRRGPHDRVPVALYRACRHNLDIA